MLIIFFFLFWSKDITINNSQPNFQSYDYYRFCGFLTNELLVASYELRVTIYCASYELLFTYELRVTIYCASYELRFRYELRVIIYCTSYELLFTYELQVTIYSTSYELN